MTDIYSEPNQVPGTDRKKPENRLWENPYETEREPHIVGLVSHGEDHQAYQILQFAFVVAPIVAGADKFTDFLVNWDQYLAPSVTRMLGIVNPHNFMMGVGVVEIIAGVGVAIKPKIFSYVVSAWLCGIILNLLMGGEYYDVALRDLGLALAAFALGRLATKFDRPKELVYDSKTVLH